jgi:hypothetical protein
MSERWLRRFFDIGACAYAQDDTVEPMRSFPCRTRALLLVVFYGFFGANVGGAGVLMGVAAGSALA